MEAVKLIVTGFRFPPTTYSKSVQPLTLCLIVMVYLLDNDINSGCLKGPIVASERSYYTYIIKMKAVWWQKWHFFHMTRSLDASLPAWVVLYPSILLSLLQIGHTKFSQCLWWTPKSISMLTALLEIVYNSVFKSKSMTFSFKLSCEPQKFIWGGILILWGLKTPM